jgi:hypothetical protein
MLNIATKAAWTKIANSISTNAVHRLTMSFKKIMMMTSLRVPSRDSLG